MTNLKLNGWRSGVEEKPVTIMKTLRDLTGASLAEARDIYTQAVDGEGGELADLTDEQAATIRGILQELGFDAEFAVSHSPPD